MITLNISEYFGQDRRETLLSQENSNNSIYKIIIRYFNDKSIL